MSTHTEVCLKRRVCLSQVQWRFVHAENFHWQVDLKTSASNKTYKRGLKFLVNKKKKKKRKKARAQTMVIVVWAKFFHACCSRSCFAGVQPIGGGKEGGWRLCWVATCSLHPEIERN
jgi:hypothetical protein